mgnify:CR=1 FL=1
MSKGLQRTGNFIKIVIDELLMIYGEVPIHYVAAILETIRREAFKNPTDAPLDVPPQWKKDPPTENLRHQMRKDVKRVVENHTDYEYRFTKEFDFIRYAGVDVAVIERDWNKEIKKELAKHGSAD